MLKVKNIAVITGTRSEYGILKPLLKKIQNTKGLKLSLYATGMHLLKKYGSTINLIKKDGFKIHKISMYKENEKEDHLGLGLSRGIKNFTKAFIKNKPDILLVFGDRLESLAAVLSAAALNVPVAHIHSGDKTDSGHIDESTRHSIERYAHLHFAPTKDSYRRLIKMGEQKFRVHYTGALAIDHILATPKQTKQKLCKDLGLDAKKEIVVCLFLPLPLESKKMGAHAKELFASVKALKKQTLIIYPNNDAGSSGIIKQIEKVRNLSHVKVVKSLPSEQYINLLKHADVLVGNSSSGIIEGPTLSLAVVNVGLRNTGREHAGNIIFTDSKSADIRRAIEKALNDKKFKAKVRACKNPYSNGDTTDKIINILKKTQLNKRLLTKQITY